MAAVYEIPDLDEKTILVSSGVLLQGLADRLEPVNETLEALE